MRPTFDVSTTPIEAGATRIEASAGTGKTFTIAGLVVRLLLENDLRIEEILVSTYTELATAELRDRIRKRIRGALTAFEAGPGDDKFLQAICKRHESDVEAARRKLNAALLSFDQAPIYTMHGFCQRMLKDRAFESGALFDAELMTDQDEVLREIADDFWRRHFYEGAPILTLIAMRHKLSADGFFADLRLITNNPTIEVVSGVDESAEALQDKVVKTCEDMKSCWRSGAERIRGHFAEGATWVHRGRRQGKPATMKDSLDKLDRCLSEVGGTTEEMECLQDLFQSKVNAAARANATAPQERLFQLCEEFAELEKNYAVRVRHDFFTWARGEMKSRKLDRNVFAFDDLLTRLDEALQDEAGGRLALMIREKFKAALIDEFQDTDPVQYRIFKKIYEKSDAPRYFIADPKQAIYGFRGADIFTYLEATDAIDRAYTLGENWRSEADLVRAVNTMFGRKKNAFVFDRIQFDPVKASGKADREPLTIDGSKEPPMRIWMALGEEPIRQPEAQTLIPSAVADEIVRLLESDAKLGERKVEPSDIAVVVAKNAEARLIQAALMERAVPGAVYSASSVFESREATEVVRILRAVAEPANERLLRGALVTDTLGVSGDALDALVRDEREWERRLMRFQEYHAMWARDGFAFMFRSMLKREEVRARLLRLRDGERRLTNLLQLAELLQGACAEQQLGMEGLLKWLAAEIQSGGANSADEYQLRLERDDKAVCIVTVHKSKGLEYGIVFCPFTWGDAKLSSHATGISYHDSNNRLTLDIASGWRDRKAMALNEELAQKIRLLYVAVTRAKHRCYLVWGNFNAGRVSAPAYVFSSIEPDGPDAYTPLADQSKARNGEAIREDVETIVGGEKAIRVVPMPAVSGKVWEPSEDSAPALAARSFGGEIDRTWGVSSFTSLLTGAEPEQPDHDDVGTGLADSHSERSETQWNAVEEPRETSIDATAEPLVVSRGSSTSLRSARNDTLIDEEASGMFAFPRGAKPGTCLHEIFEKIDFSDLTKMPGLVRDKLQAFGIRGFDATVCEMIGRMATVPLDTRKLKLENVPRSACLHEMEFHFPIDALTTQRLSRFFKQHHPGEAIPAAIDRLKFDVARGFMKGFVDLVFQYEEKFYILDWKSNWLGNDLASYGSEALAAEMARTFYLLQLHIYTAAVHRYLEHRLAGYDYDKHFGGVFYAFLRGVDPKRPECGIHRERPTREAVEALDRVLGGGKEGR